LHAHIGPKKELLYELFSSFFYDAGDAHRNEDKEKNRKEKNHFEPPCLVYYRLYIKVIFPPDNFREIRTT